MKDHNKSEYAGVIWRKKEILRNRKFDLSQTQRKIIYNGEVIYDDYDGDETVESARRIEEAYKDKIVYRMDVRIVDWHHCILTIRGE